MVRLVLGAEAAQKLSDVSLSNNTIQRRIRDMSGDVKDQIIEEIKASPIFAMQVDESTDVAIACQLLVYCRYLLKSIIKEEFLCCQNLETSSTATDVMNAVSLFFDKHDLNWNKLVGITTDGAPAMLRLRSDFQAKVKSKAPNTVGVHCFIHREVLGSKSLPSGLLTIFTGIVKVVNYVKNSALNTRLFQQLCHDMESEHSSLLFYTSEILKSEHFELRLAYLVDIFEIFNQLNLRPQGKASNLLSHCDSIHAFLAKLELYKKRVSVGKFMMFPSLNEVLVDGQLSSTLSKEIMDHLSQLDDEFCRYFPDLSPQYAGLAKNPILCQVDDVLENA
ncbi:SCAN domain-containing protein 3-like [Palaemon carinicauda]|uniref:SCAN domain-containing protein 3-like n=1 Tax=Palaemon carinicauda TaxID=392227 RepID=UPI0035B6683F